MSKIVEERIKRWKNKLIDLSKRNRLLNFKPTKVSTVRIIDEIPSEIFQILVHDGKEMTFMPKSHDDKESEDSEDSQDIEFAPEEFRSYEKDSLHEKHVDVHLQTNLNDKRLDKNLFRIASISSSVMEEQGYNALFLAVGFLEWYESKESEVKFLAPIILIPVELSRKSVKSPFVLTYAEEVPILNPALVYKLELDFGIKIDKLVEDLENVEPKIIFEKVKEAVGQFDRWRVTNDIYLGLFSFDKFIMFKDLETNQSRLIANEVIRSVCGIVPEKNLSINQICSMEEVEKNTRPQKTFQVLDADSSQQRAILVIKKGHHLIIEGPPGTGKSQTIANMIAECLVEGKKCLFVSQKMAALEVVKKRLEKVGMGDYCLELHSRKTNKKKVIEELGKVMQQPKRPDHDHDQDLVKLEQLRVELNNYVRELHSPFGSLGMTPFKAIGVINSNSDIEDISFLFSKPEEWERNKFEACIDLMDRLGRNLINIQDPATHPWRLSRLTELSYSTKLRSKELMSSFLKSSENLKSNLKELSQTCFYASVKFFRDIEDLIDVAGVLAASPHPSRNILENSRWNSLSAEISDLLNTVKGFEELKQEIITNYDFKVIDQDAELLSKRYQKYAKNFLFFLQASFWKDRKYLKSLFIIKERKNSLGEIAKELEKINEARKLALKIDTLDTLGKELFGNFWKGRNSSWQELDGFANWIVRFRQHVIKKHFDEKIFAEGETQYSDKERILRVKDQLNGRWEEIKNLLKSIIDLLKLERLSNDFLNESISETLQIIREMLNTAEESDPWFSYQRILQECEKESLGDFINLFLDKKLPYEKIVPFFKCQFLRCWLDAVFTAKSALKNFQGKSHEQLIDAFRELDKKQIELSKVRIQHMLSGNYDQSWEGSANSERGILEREVRKSRAHKPLRKLFHEIPHLLLNLKPCLMMSPLSVAQFLEPELFKFDVVIFDEASQVPPEDSIGSIMRGKQVVIAGDTKQLPPTSFFQTAVITPEDEEEDFEEYMPDDLDSILDECATAGFPRTMLEWHYRSRHESLIAFSNKHYYNYRLNTFPNAEDTHSVGLKFNYLPNNVYKKGGVNLDEAKEIAKRVFQHFKEYPQMSLGVGTFSLKQKYAVEDAIEELRKQDSSLEDFFATDRSEHFFVKNLESIQGDERDVIFLSIGYGKDPVGKLSMNFGPINKLGGERRLNVLVTRARLRLEIFSSVRGIDFDLSKTDSSGVHLLKQYLDYAEMGKEILLKDITLLGHGEEDSLFEESVYQALLRWGITTHKQVGCSGYRIDLAVVDPNHPGRYILGIECDGARYHSSVTARDRDRLRQQVLEELGWNIYRIWSTDWFRNRKKETERLVNMINEVQSGNCKKKLKNFPNFEIKLDFASVKATSASSEVYPYVLMPVKNVRKPESFYYAENYEIANILVNVVRHEGPIHVEEARRRVIEHWGLTSIGKRIQEILKSVEDYCVSQKRIVRKSEFLWPVESVDLKIRSRDVAGVTKRIEYVPPEEVEGALKIVLKKEFSISEDSLISQTAKLLGFGRVGNDIADYVKKSLKKLLNESVILEKGGKLTLRQDVLI